MSMTARESLRQLCSDYYHGMMSTDDYRHRRASLLDEAILPHAVPMEADTEHAPTRPTARETRIEPAAERLPVNTSAPRRKVTHLTTAAVAALALIFVVLCLVLLVSFA